MRREAIALSLVAAIAGGCDSASKPITVLGSKGRTALFSVFRKSPRNSSCIFDDPKGCPEDELCVLSSPGSDSGVCAKRAAAPAPLIRFPFEPEHAVRCVQGARNPAGDHSTLERSYAVDLSSVEKAGIVYAGMNGVALVYNACGREKRDIHCGGGFGNHVRILQQNGLMLLYAHLSEIYIEDGQPIRAGDKIGLEGATGSIPTRALHLSAHYGPAENWLDSLSKYREAPGATPPSIPFELQYCDPSLEKECRRSRARVEKLPCDGRRLLRADWRP